MKAVLSKIRGGAETLELNEIAVPISKIGEALVRIRSVGVNFRDSLIIEDKYQFKAERPFSPCGEIAGIIEEIGVNHQGFSKGDAVFADIGWGGLAEFACVEVGKLHRIPNGLGFANAAASIITYGTGLYALKNRAQLKPYERLLVLGAAGGVGIAALQLGKTMGAEVIGAVSSPEKAQIALAHGAGRVIIYPKGPFDDDGRRSLKEQFKEFGSFDVIYDAIGGDYSEAAMRAMNFNGRFLVVGFPSGIPKIPLNLTLVKACSIIGIFFSEFQKREPDLYDENLIEIADLIKSGKIEPLISARFSLEKAAEAIQMLKNREAVGKVLVEIE